MNRVLNFDLFMQEKNKDTIDVTVLGCVYKVSAEIPAIVPVMMARAEHAKDPQLATKMVMRAADAMFGAKAIDEMCENGISASDLADLVERLFKEINNPDGDDSDDMEEYSDEDSRKAIGGNGGNEKK